MSMLLLPMNYFKRFFKIETTKLHAIFYSALEASPLLAESFVVDVPLSDLFLFAFGLISTGLFGLALNNHNFLKVLLCTELALLGLSVLFLTSSVYFFDPSSQIYSLLVLVVSVAESVVGLSVCILVYRSSRTLNHNSYGDFSV